MNKYQEKFQKNPNQMYRINSRGKFAEFLKPNPDFQKVTLNICSYDDKAPQGQRITGKASCYFDLPYFLELCRAIANNEIYSKISSVGNYTNVAPDIYGGSEKGAAERGWRLKGWHFTIEKANKGVFLKIYTGEGYIDNETGNWRLVQNKDQKPEVMSILTSWQDLYEMAAICKTRTEAVIFRMEMLGFFDYVPQGNNNIPPIPPESIDSNTQMENSQHFQRNNGGNVVPMEIGDYGDGWGEELPFPISS